MLYFHRCIHFLSIGKYMYIEASGVSQGRKARLISPGLNRTNGACVEFWYHMYGFDTGNLTVSEA